VVQFSFPFTYGTSYSNAVAGTSNPGNRTLTGADSFSAIGYGTLKLPGGHTYSNVLLTRFVLDQSTTVSGYTIHIRTVWYDYVTPGYDFFLFELSNTTTTTTIGPNTTTISGSVAEYALNLPTTLGINDLNDNMHLSLFPNPNHGTFTIATVNENLKGATVSVADLLGHSVYTGTLTEATQTVTLPEGAKGMYILQIQSATGTTSRKILID
jgi:hypothetical protein